MKDKLHPIVDKLHQYKVIYFGYTIDKDDYRNSFIDIHLKRDSEVKKLRFYRPVDLEIEKGFNGSINGMEILDVRARQLDGIGVKVGNFEQDSGVTFLAKEVKEINELMISDDANYRLYVGNKHLYFRTFEEAQWVATRYMLENPELRIEILAETQGADFWAYEYETKQWVPS